MSRAPRAATLGLALAVAAVTVSTSGGSTTAGASSTTTSSGMVTAATATRTDIANASSTAAADTTAVEAAGDGATSVPPATTVTPHDPEALTIGVLLPTSAGPGQVLGTVGVNAVARTVNDEVAGINALGGVNGRNINLVFVDEGSTVDSAAAQARALIDLDVDAIIGPASSTAALAVLPQLMAAGIVTCSPTASSLDLDQFPERRFFFRTIASDSLMTHALAHATRNSAGSREVSVVYVDDQYGRGLFQSLRQHLTEQGVALLAAVPIAPADDEVTDDLAPIVQQHAERPIVVLGDAEHGYRILQAFSAMADRFPDEQPQPIFVSEAIVAPDPETAAALDERIRSSVQRMSRQAFPSPLPQNEGGLFPDGAFAVNAMMCVETIAIAAELEGTDPADFVNRMVDVTVNGVQCYSFQQCVQNATAGVDIDYSGPAGGFSLLDRGDPNGATMVIYRIGDNGLEYPSLSLVVTDPATYREQGSTAAAIS